MLLGTLKPIRRVYEGGRIHALIFLNYKYIPNRLSPRSIKIKSDRELGERTWKRSNHFLDFVSSTRYRRYRIGRGGKEKEKKEMSVEEWNGERTLLFWPLK